MTLSSKARATLAQLNERMEAQGEFPAFASAVERVTDALGNDNQNAADLAQAVLSDFSLTQKVLRLANSAMYRTIAGEVTTVSRAILMLGVETVGNLAVSLKLLNAFSEIVANNDEARDCLTRSMLAGTMARNIVAQAGIREGEEIVVSTLMHSLGELLVSFYLPQSWRAVRAAEEGGASAKDAQVDVLGMTVHVLAREVMRQWRMPDRLVSAVEPRDIPLEGDVALDHGQWLSAMAQFSHDLAGSAVGGVVPDHRIEELSGRYCQLLALNPDDVTTGLANLEVDSEEKRHIVEMLSEAGKAETLRVKPLDVARRLRQAIKEPLQPASAATLQLNLADTVEGLYTSLGAQRTVLFARNGQKHLYRARLAFADGGERATLEAQEFPEAFAPDIFHLALTNGGQPIWVETASLAHISRRMPEWHRKNFPNTASFLIVPVAINNVCPLLVYMDWAQPTQLCPDELRLVVSMASRLGTSLRQAMKMPLAA